MLHRYVSRVLSQWAALRHGGTAKRWARRAFTEFEVSTERREEMIASIVTDALKLARLADELGGDADGDGRRRRLADFLLQACQRVDSGDVRHSSVRFRSYVDVSVQAKALRAFADYVSSRHAFAGDPVNVTALLVEAFPDSRPALLAHAELLLERRHLDAALAVIQRALRIQAVCPSAQQLLRRVRLAQRENGDTGELDGT